jgi:hypothetical protein
VWMVLTELRQVTLAEATARALELRFAGYYEVSSVTGQHVSAPFFRAAQLWSVSERATAAARYAAPVYLSAQYVPFIVAIGLLCSLSHVLLLSRTCRQPSVKSASCCGGGFAAPATFGSAAPYRAADTIAVSTDAKDIDNGTLHGCVCVHL